MSKYIDVDDITYNYIIPSTTTNTPCTLAVTKDKIDAMPTVDVAPVIHAKLLNPNPYGSCSICNYLIDIREEFSYCPKCGAMLEINEVTK